MDWKESARSRLADHLDVHGDIAPPWEEFPTYERYSLGWRMGGGEDWISLWSVFMEDLGTNEAVRHAYLKRHRPAPMNWASNVWHVRHPDMERLDELTPAQYSELFEEGLIGHDVAYETWRTCEPDALSWRPWTHADSPEEAARYDTRELLFWGRRVHEERVKEGEVKSHAADVIPEAWVDVVRVLRSGKLEPYDIKPEQGLWLVAMMCATGQVMMPWELGCDPGSFEDSFEMDMHYVDAFRLWSMSAFDDLASANLVLGEVPEAWRAWVEEQIVGSLV
jgi:hypothetical protein